MASRRQREKRKAVTADRRIREHKTFGRGSFCVQLPEGYDWFNVENEGPYEFDLVPYVVGKGNPFQDKGNMHYERTYFRHPGLGPDGKQMRVCSAQTFGDRCFPCEYQAKLRRKGLPNKDPQVKNLFPKERQLWLIKPKGKKKVLVWDVSHHLFGKQLDAKIQTKLEKYRKFADPDEGMTLTVKFIKKSAGKEGEAANPFWEASNIELDDREKPLSDEILDMAICLDKTIIKPDYDEVKKLFLKGVSNDDEDEEEEDEDEDEEEDEEEGDEEDDDDDDDDEEDDDDDDDDNGDDDDDDEEDDDDGDGDEEDDDDDDEDDDMPKSRKSKVKKKKRK